VETWEGEEGAVHKKEERKEPVSAYVDATMVDCMKKIAEMDNRSLSWLIGEAMRDYCVKRKALLSKKEPLRREA